MIQKKIPLAKIVFRAMIVVILLLLLVSFIYPLFWMIISALKTNTEIFTTSYQLPKIPQWKNFVKVWNVGVKNYFLNSIIMTVASCLLTTSISGFAAFALCRYRFRTRHAILIHMEPVSPKSLHIICRRGRIRLSQRLCSILSSYMFAAFALYGGSI